MKLLSGKNTLTVRMSAPEGLGAIKSGVTLTRFEKPDWSRKAFHGLCMAMIEKDSKLTVTATGDGLETGTLVIE